MTECWRPEVPAPPYRLPPDLGEHLAPVSVEELDHAAKSFKWNTGLGSDQFHPRHIPFLSVKAKRWVCLLFTMFDGLGALPETQKHLTYVVMGKDDGGTRLIALLGTLYRAWAIVRLPLVRQWAADNDRMPDPLVALAQSNHHRT